ncbi:hypothetical protein GRX01_06850 [Halobaculum sp. WSA2]|uniref:Uncharacterized protein n=1 Tax=Halobaculum saliterrae TaxID=2073113 RepID=A0A6B0SR93_9EURY|nr:hypothetical protein [Halobaculum saliterrae]MXR41057.1 hypothetical protein [Halobaculum saliterrae]
MTERDAPGDDDPTTGSDAGAPTNAPADAAPELFGGDAGRIDVTAEGER